MFLLFLQSLSEGVLRPLERKQWFKSLLLYITIIRHLPQVFTCGNQPKEYYLFRYERYYNKITFTRAIVSLIDPRKVRVSPQLCIGGNHCDCTCRVLPISLSYFKVSHGRVQARNILRGRHIPRHLSRQEDFPEE